MGTRRAPWRLQVLCACAVAIGCASGSAWPQTAQPGGAPEATPAPVRWPADGAALDFRRRVMDLALLYGTSSGLDAQGFLVAATDQGVANNAPGQGNCHLVQVQILWRGQAVQQDALVHCKP